MALGGPIPDKSFPVLVFNMERADEFVNSTNHIYIDRFDKTRKTVAGIEAEFDEQLSSQQNEFNVAMANAGGIDAGDYEDSPTLTLFTEYVVFDRDGTPSAWKAKSTTPLPHVIDFATYPNPYDNPFVQLFVNDLTELESVAHANNVAVDVVGYISVGSVDGVTYFYDNTTNKTYYSPVPVSDNITSINYLGHGSIELIGDGGTYVVSEIQRGVGRYSISTLQSVTDLPLADGAVVDWLGYYEIGDGGKGSGVIKKGSHTEDSGSIFTIFGDYYLESIFDGNQINLKHFGLTLDGVTDDYLQLMRALSYASENRKALYMPKGTLLVSDEVQVPSHVTLVGEDKELCIIKSSASFAVNKNTITTSNNNRLEHANYNENIHLANITIDGNYQNRDQSGSAENNGSALKIVTTRDSSFKNLITKNGMLHCFDIAASIYAPEGDTSYEVDGPSYNITVDKCLSQQALRDDMFTTHNSHDIIVKNSISYFDRDTYGEPLYNQHGFEADEGSFDVTFQDCIAIGTTTGFQAKGHETTKSASYINFVRCETIDTAYGFQAEHPSLTSPNGKNVLIRDCIVNNVIPHTALNRTAWVYVNTFDGVLIDNLTVKEAGDGGIYILDDSPALASQDVTIKNLKVYGFAEALTGEDNLNDIKGLIHAYSSLSTGTVSIDGVFSDTAQRRPVVVFNNSDSGLLVKNINCDGASSPYPCVKVPSFNNDLLAVSGINSSGYGGLIGDDDNNYNNNIELYFGRRKVMTNVGGSPEGVVYAPAGTILIGQTTGRHFRKDLSSGSSNTGWVEITK